MGLTAATRSTIIIAFGVIPQALLSASDVERNTVAGLTEPVDIVVDRWGIAHISARNEADLFFAQGYSAAGERLFQFELFRRQATGTVAAMLGRRELRRDIGARLLKFRGDLDAELNHYHPRGAEIIQAFVRGINARIEEVRKDPSQLPIEFRLLGILPEPWTPDVVVSRHQGLVHNLTQELALGRAVALLGSERTVDLVDFHPGRPDVSLDPAIDGHLLFADVLELYRESRSPIRFRPEDVVDDARRAVTASPSIAPLAGFEQSAIDLRDVGSNNWVVSGSRTMSGKPLLANDPHRVLHVPSLRTFVHLRAPGWNVIGGGEPILPGVSVGHNEHGAWGLTVFRIDAEDLYVYQTDPDNPLRYKYGDGWEDMRIVREVIEVQGERPVDVELHFTRHGPVLHENHERHRAYALRAGWLEAGAAPYLASLRLNGARNWDEFREACTKSYLPGENMVWAGNSGDIGWQAVGIAPIRPNWSGLVPVPGDGRYEWQGFLPIRELPHLRNPDRGYWNTSNEALIPAGYPHRAAVGWTWADPYRGDRVREVLSGSQQQTAADMARLQLDELSIPARELVPLLARVLGDAPRYQPSLTLLRDWDFQLRADSVAAGIYVMYERQLQDNVRKQLVPAEVINDLPELSMRKLIDWLNSPDGRWGPHPEADRDQLVRTSFEGALTELTRRFGPDMANWKYGQPGYKHSQLHHPLSAAVDMETRRQLDIGPLPRGGNSYTVNNTGRPDNQPTGGTFRVVIDTADWDQSLATNSPGQGGDPNSPHYRDLFEPWATGQHFPLLYSADKIDAAASRRMRLVPTH